MSGGRYSSSQIDLPFAIVSKCIRLHVESQSPANQNAGLRWELLGCSSGKCYKLKTLMVLVFYIKEMMKTDEIVKIEEEMENRFHHKLTAICADFYNLARIYSNLV